MNATTTIDVNHSHVPGPQYYVRDDVVRGDSHGALAEAGMTYRNDRKMVPVTLGLLAIMALVSVALIVAAVLLRS